MQQKEKEKEKLEQEVWHFDQKVNNRRRATKKTFRKDANSIHNTRLIKTWQDYKTNKSQVKMDKKILKQNRWIQKRNTIIFWFVFYL